MKKLREIFNASRKNYADTRELDYKKVTYKNLEDYNREEHLKEHKIELLYRANMIVSIVGTFLKYGPDDYTVSNVEGDMTKFIHMLKSKMWKEINWR